MVEVVYFYYVICAIYTGTPEFNIIMILHVSPLLHIFKFKSVEKGHRKAPESVSKD